MDYEIIAGDINGGDYSVEADYAYHGFPEDTKKDLRPRCQVCNKDGEFEEDVCNDCIISEFGDQSEQAKRRKIGMFAPNLENCKKCGLPVYTHGDLNIGHRVVNGVKFHILCSTPNAPPVSTPSTTKIVSPSLVCGDSFCMLPPSMYNATSLFDTTKLAKKYRLFEDTISVFINGANRTPNYLKLTPNKENFARGGVEAKEGMEGAYPIFFTSKEVGEWKSDYPYGDVIIAGRHGGDNHSTLDEFTIWFNKNIAPLIGGEVEGTAKMKRWCEKNNHEWRERDMEDDGVYNLNVCPAPKPLPEPTAWERFFEDEMEEVYGVDLGKGIVRYTMAGGGSHAWDYVWRRCSKTGRRVFIWKFGEGEEEYEGYDLYYNKNYKKQGVLKLVLLCEEERKDLYPLTIYLNVINRPKSVSMPYD